MIHITYSDDEKALAERIRDDLAHSVPLSGPVLIVLVSRTSLADRHVQAEVDKSLAKGIRIIPIVTEELELPERFMDRRPLDISGGYDRERLLARLEQAAMRSQDLRRANRRAFALIGGIALLVFAVALVTINRGLIAFPVTEYNEEATFQSKWIGGLIGETLEAVQPRSTEDALNFPATHEAAPTRLYLYIRETATALPRSGGS